MQWPRFLVLISLILLSAATRLIPHPPNFSPIGAMALFGGASFAQKRWAFVVPLMALFVSDWVLGFHQLMPVVYGSFALIVCIGFWLRRRRTVVPIAGAALASSVLFFLLTNFGVWALGFRYPKTWDGFVACYVAAIPFFQNTLLGDAVYATVLFGGLGFAEKSFPVLRTENRAQAIPAVK